MLTQAELNFYGYNPNNIIQRARRGHITVILKYDSENRFFVVTRKTPKTIWIDRYSGLLEAKERFLMFLYSTNEQLENAVKKWGKTYGSTY